MTLHGDRIAPLTEDQRSLVAANTGLVSRYLKTLGAPMDGSYDDDMQDGMFGLMQAAQSWDPSKGTFYTYAYQPIRWYVSRGRKIRGGVSYRGSVNRGEWFTAPLSLDRPLRRGDDGGPPLTLGSMLADEPHEPSTAPERAEHLLALLSERDRIIVLSPSSEAAEITGLKQRSVLRRRVRLYARLREQVAS